MEALKTKEEAAQAVKHYAHALCELGILTTARDKAVLDVQTKYQPGIDAKSQRVKDLAAQLETWANENPKEFGDAQSLEFAFGWLKFRMSPRSLVTLSKWTWAKTLEKLQSFPVTSQWREYIRTKEEVNKQKLLEATKHDGRLPESKLREIGLRVQQEQVFSIEAKPDMVAQECDLMP